MKKQIPNFITLLSLASGVIAVLFATQNQLEYAAYFVFIGIIFDFFDGFTARILNVKSELGLQLDSLADMVTSGVAPGIVIFQLIKNNVSTVDTLTFLSNIKNINYLPFLGILITLAAAYRLAKFNIDDRQTANFIGLPTPALSIFVVSIPLIIKYSDTNWAIDFFSNTYFLIATVFIGSYLMNSEFSMFSLKFSNFSFKANKIKYIFLIILVSLIVIMKTVSIPLIIILYISMSLINNLWLKSK
jgi:CDP-diacylglycerol--serine O-phosphatidyltransferase